MQAQLQHLSRLCDCVGVSCTEDDLLCGRSLHYKFLTSRLTFTQDPLAEVVAVLLLLQLDNSGVISQGAPALSRRSCWRLECTGLPAALAHLMQLAALQAGSASDVYQVRAVRVVRIVREIRPRDVHAQLTDARRTSALAVVTDDGPARMMFL